MRENILNKVKKLHFVGIGGSGMCPMAEILMAKGYEITGSDIYESDTLERIRNTYNVKIYMGHAGTNIEPDCEALVYTAAVKQDNPELVQARNMGIPVIERSEMLGMLTDMYENTVAVSGTHGKTTTTGMLTQIFIEGEKDPSAVIGGKLQFIGGNGKIGQSEDMICEACEYVDTFLHLYPNMSVILNVDADHLDYFKNLDNIIASFNKFSKQTKSVLIVNGDDENALKAVSDIKDKEIITFGYGENNNYRAVIGERPADALSSFTVYKNGEVLGEFKLIVPGEHNILNALAAISASDYNGVDLEKMKKALHEFKGVHRRFEILGNFGGITVADDFAHHPTELRATLSAAMNMGFNNVWALFQPHTFSRTFMLLDDFASALSIPDKVVLSEILPVREENIYNIYTKDLADKIEGSVWFNTFEEMADYTMANAKEGDLILTLGGGDVYKLANMIAKRYSER